MIRIGQIITEKCQNLANKPPQKWVILSDKLFMILS